MAGNGVEQTPSETAYFAALRRAIAYFEFQGGKLGPDNLAQYFLPSLTRFLIRFKGVRARVINRLDEFLPGLYEYVIARTAFFDQLFVEALRDNFPQIVLMGAGYDTRAYRFTHLNTVTNIFELDIAPTQNSKKEFLKKAGIDVTNKVTFVPIDFNKESLHEVLGKAGYESTEKTLFFWEGVSYYLQQEAVDETLNFLSHHSSQESRIAFDYVITISEENVGNYFGAQQFLQTMREHHADEELMFAIEGDQTASLLEDRGLQLIDHLDNEQIEKKYLTIENGSILGQITGIFRFAIASPKGR